MDLKTAVDHTTQELAGTGAEPYTAAATSGPSGGGDKTVGAFPSLGGFCAAWIDPLSMAAVRMSPQSTHVRSPCLMSAWGC